MNWRRAVLILLGVAGAAFMLTGAFARDPIWMAIGAVCAFAGVAIASLMLSRQIAWLSGEVGNTRGFIVDKVLTLGAQLKAQDGLLTAQKLEISRLRSLLVEHAQANKTEQRKRFEHLEAVANELFVSSRLQLVSDVEAVHQEIATAASNMKSLQEGFVGAISSSEKSLQEGFAGTAAVHAESIAYLRRLEEALSSSLGSVCSLEESTAILLRLQEEIRSEVADGANLAMRAYRELTESVEEGSRLMSLRHEETSQRLLAGMEEASRSTELLAGVEDIKSVLAKDGDRSQSMLDGLMELRRTASTEDGVKASLESLGRMSKAIEGLRSLLIDMHRTDKEGLKKFVSDEKKLRKMSQLSMQWLKTEILHEIEALSQLRPLLGVEGATPLLGGWAMDAAAIHALVGIVREKRPLRIVELGSGSSTVWLALALRSVGRGRIVSFDHLDIYGQRTSDAIKEQGLEDFAQVRVRRLVSLDLEGEKFDWYDLHEDESLGPIDILLVDGPPGGTGPMARFPALPILWSQLARDALIIVDDASRPDERHMLESWREAFPDLGELESIGARTTLLQRRSGVQARKKD